MPLQRSFRGLSDHIGSFLGGNINQELSPVLVQQISAEDFINPYEFIRNTAGLTAIGQAIVQTVPEGEVWRVRSISADFLNAGGNTALQAVWNPDGIGLVGLTPNTTTSIAAGVRGFNGFRFEIPPFICCGGQVGFQVSFFTIGTANIDLVVERQKIRV